MTSYSLTPFSRDGVEGVVVGPTPNAKYGKAATGEEEGVDAKVGGCVSEAGGEEAEEGASRITSFLIKKIIFFTCNPSQRKITIDTTGGMPAWPINNDVGS